MAWRTVLLGKTPLAAVPAMLVTTIPHVVTRSWLFWVPGAWERLPDAPYCCAWSHTVPAPAPSEEEE